MADTPSEEYSNMEAATRWKRLDYAPFFKRIAIRHYLPHIAWTPTPMLESWGGISDLFPCPCLLSYTRQLLHSTQDVTGSCFFSHTIKEKQTAKAAFGIRHCSAWFVGTKILHWANLMYLKDNLWIVLITLYQFFTIIYEKRYEVLPIWHNFQSKQENLQQQKILC